MITQRTIWLCLIIFFISSCGKGIDKNTLAGKWELTKFIEQGKEKKINVNEVSFEFFESGRYDFNSTLNYSESGRYYTMGQLLYTTDTTVSNPIEKVVKVINLTTDSLHFKMNDKGIDQDLYLSKVK